MNGGSPTMSHPGPVPWGQPARTRDRGCKMLRLACSWESGTAQRRYAHGSLSYIAPEIYGPGV